MQRSLASTAVRFVRTLALLCLLAAEAPANHLHYIPITDSRYEPSTLAEVLSDPEAPLYQWIVFTGGDEYTVFSNDGTTMTVSSPVGLAEVLIDAPAFADATNPRATAFYELEVSALETSGIQTIELGLTDIATKVKWDEAAGEISGTKSGLEGDDVSGIPRWSTLGSFPLRVRMYYHFDDFVITFVVDDDLLGASAPISWQGSVNAFQNFFGQVGGTDRDNLDIYPFVLCEANCTVTALAWETLNCDTVAGAVDVENCRPFPA